VIPPSSFSRSCYCDRAVVKIFKTGAKKRGNRDMTRSRSHEIECSHCGLKQEVNIWESINVSVDPDLKQRLFQGLINVFKCQKCEKDTFISVPLFYHDMERRFCVQFFPFDWLEDDGLLSDAFTREGELNTALFQLPDTPDDMKRTHIVFDMDELLRYVVFREKLHGAWRKTV
jgi:hypothetical protein